MVQYIDDIFFSSDDENHLTDQLERLIKKLSDAGLKIGIKKSQISRTEVIYLVFKIDESGIQVTDNYLKEMTPPKDLLELERVLGKFQFISGNIPNYAVHVAKLMELKIGLRKRKEEQKIQVFNRLLTEEELLEYSNFVKYVEATKIALSQRNYSVDLVLTTNITEDGAVVYFSNEGETGVVCIKNARFCAAERKFMRQEQELAVLFQAYPMAIALWGERNIRVNSVTGVVKELTKNTVAAGRALQSYQTLFTTQMARRF